MQICGLNKTTLLDYPEHVAATVFTGGCNFRCPFCHNSSLVIQSPENVTLTTGQVLTFLEKRKGILEGVCITGGEPTLQPDLESFLIEVKALGYLVKLDSNGYRPDVLKELVEKKLVDYIAMDVKASRENYARVAGCSRESFETDRIDESIRFLKSCGVAYEFRTTAVKGLHKIEEFESIGRWLKGAGQYFLQGYQESEGVLQPGYKAFTMEEMKVLQELAGKYIDKVYIRGVE